MLTIIKMISPYFGLTSAPKYLFKVLTNQIKQNHIDTDNQSVTSRFETLPIIALRELHSFTL